MNYEVTHCSWEFFVVIVVLGYIPLGMFGQITVLKLLELIILCLVMLSTGYTGLFVLFWFWHFIDCLFNL